MARLPPARRAIHEAAGRDVADKAALVLAFLLGAGGTVLLKLNGAPVLATALWPVAILAGYVVATILTRAVAAEPEVVGDNCYYLGFLFTLSSLAVTLYQIRGIGPDASGAASGASVIPEVIAGFGVALSSTIAGVFARVALMQMRPDLAARDREARRDLAAGARDLRGSVAAASRMIKASALEATQHAAERSRRMDELSDEHARRSAELLVRQAEAFEDMARGVALRLADDLHATLIGEAERAAATLAEAADRLAASLDRLSGARHDAFDGLDEDGPAPEDPPPDEGEDAAPDGSPPLPRREREAAE